MFLIYHNYLDQILFLPVQRPVPSFIYPASQLHTVVAHVACAGQLAVVLAQSVVVPSAFTVTEQVMWKHIQTCFTHDMNICEPLLYVNALNALYYLQIQTIDKQNKCTPEVEYQNTLLNILLKV